MDQSGRALPFAPHTGRIEDSVSEIGGAAVPSAGRRALRILLIEDSAKDAELLLHTLRRDGYEPTCTRVETAAGMSDALAHQSWDVVITDYSLPSFSAPMALELLHRTGRDLPFIVVSGSITEDTALDVMKAGAHDYLLKGNLKRLTATIEREIREASVRRQNLQSQELVRRSEERFRQMAENIAEVFWMTNPEKSETLYVSPAYETIWGRPCEELYAEPGVWMDAIHPEDRSRIGAAARNQASGGYHEEFRIVRPDGSTRWISDRAFPVRNGAGEVYRVTGIAEDITERKQAVEALKESVQRLSMAIDAACMYTWDWDIKSGRVVRVGRYAELHGSVDQSETVMFADFQRSIHPADRARFDLAIGRAVKFGDPCRVEYRVIWPDGQIRWFITRGQAHRDGSREALRMIGVTTDITERKKAEELIERAAFFDSMTGLPNRNKLTEVLRELIQEDDGRGRSLSLLLMDLNNFKEINDTLGHDWGDFVLKEVAGRLQGIVAYPDLLARLGGDVFAVLLCAPNIDADASVEMVRKIREILHPPVLVDGLPIAVETTTGIALYPDSGKDAESLVRRADIAMHAAKKSGTDSFIYETRLDQHSPERLSLMAELRHAIEQNQLILHYQPKIDLRAGEVCGAEALVRWLHPTRGMVRPDEFIGLAERTGLIHPLTAAVLSCAVRQCHDWQKEGLTVPLAVNLSARNLFDPQLPEQIMQLLVEHDILPDWLSVEITESAIMADPTRARDVMLRIHALGIQISIDDFGIGYSSLAYLRKLPVDRLKVDKSFVMHMAQDEGDAVIVRSTIDLAHNLGIEVVAEGVENETAYRQLLEWGCDSAQGYFMSKPLPAEQFAAWIRETRWAPPSHGQKEVLDPDKDQIAS